MADVHHRGPGAAVQLPHQHRGWRLVNHRRHLGRRRHRPRGGSDAATSSGGTTYTGSVASTRWGHVQVTITVTDGQITSVSVPTYPNTNGRDKEINAYALPILKQETLSAQSADIDTVSGATVTSDGYKQSLQAALDAAHLS